MMFHCSHGHNDSKSQATIQPDRFEASLGPTFVHTSFPSSKYNSAIIALIPRASTRKSIKLVLLFLVTQMRLCFSDRVDDAHYFVFITFYCFCFPHIFRPMSFVLQTNRKTHHKINLTGFFSRPKEKKSKNSTYGHPILDSLLIMFPNFSRYACLFWLSYTK